MNLEDAPAGIPWLVWLMFVMFFGPPALASKAAARIPGVLGATGRWWQARKVAAVSHDRLQRVQADLEALRADYEQLRKDHARDKAELRADNRELGERVDTLEASLTAEKRLRWAAIEYIRRLIDHARQHAPEVPIPDAPVPLQDII